MRMIAFHRGAHAPKRKGANHALVERLKHFCAANMHTWVDIAAPKDGYLDDAQLDAQYSELLRMVTPPEGKPALVVLPDATHLSSDLGTYAERLLELQSLNCDVRCADQDIPDPLQNGDAYLGPAAAAQPRRTPPNRRAIAMRAAEGEVLGRLPYGYRCGETGKFEVALAEAQVVLRIFAMYTGAEGQPPMGLRRIARVLNTEGLRTRHGRPWSPVTLSHLLRNRAYLGNYSRYGIKRADNHPPLVPRDLFQRAQDIIASRQPQRRRPAERIRFLLIGLLHCSECQTKLKGISRRRAWVNEDGRSMERTYRYYECPLRGTSEGHASWSADKLHKRFYAWAASLSERSMAGVLERYAQRKAQGGAAAKALADRRFADVVRAVSSGHGSMFDLEDAVERLKGERSEIAGLGASDIALPTLMPALEGAGTADAQDIARAILSHAEADRKRVAFTAHA